MSNTSLEQNFSPEKRLALMRWRARRGLVENDILLKRFLDAHEKNLTDRDIQALLLLLDLPDNDLLDVFLKRREIDAVPELSVHGKEYQSELVAILAKIRV